MSKTGPSRTEYILEMYEKGMTLEEIGREVGLTRERIRQILEPFGIVGWRQLKHVKRYGSLRAWEEALRNAHDRYMAGERSIDIEADLGIADKSLWSMFAARGWETLPRRKGPGSMGAKHGSRTMYASGCRCEACKQANRDYMKSLQLKEAPNHGTESGYVNYGCRCAACKQAGSLHNRRGRLRRKMRQNQEK